MNYDKFHPSDPRKAAQSPRVAVSPSGMMSINRVAYLQYMKGATYVELFFDAKAHKVGMRPKKYKTRDGVKLTVIGKEKTHYRLNARPFCETFGITLEKRMRIDPEWDEENQLLVLQI